MARPHVAFLSFDAPAGWCIQDGLTIPALQARGWDVTERVNWHDYESIPWAERFDAVVVRSTWDYQEHVEEFCTALRHIVSDGSCASEPSKRVALFNGLETLLWNVRKTYLLDIARGAPCEKGTTPPFIVPSVYLHDRACFQHLLPPGEGSAEGMISRSELKEVLGRSLELYAEVLLKPIVGASSFDIYRVARETAQEPFVFREDETVLELRGRPTEFPSDAPAAGEGGERCWPTQLDFLYDVLRAHAAQFMLQPVIASIASFGEVSCFCFNGKVSHIMRKVPKEGDFRAQEDYGARHERVAISELDPALLQLCNKVFAHFPAVPLYARIDAVQMAATDLKLCQDSRWGVCGGEELSSGMEACHWALMEVEAIEPSLYFNICEEGIANFADAFCEAAVKQELLGMKCHPQHSLTLGFGILKENSFDLSH